jgi:hypothetical protein
MALPLAARTALTRAELAIREAQVLFDEEDFRAAAFSARTADELAGGASGESERLVARFRDPARLDTWLRWSEDAVAATRREASAALLVDKLDHQAYLYLGGKCLARFDVDLGYNSFHPKRVAGDGATPEGRYRVTKKKGRGETRYYKALLLDYPNDEDVRRFRDGVRERTLAPRSHIGSLIEIHGDGGQRRDWTDGCVAMANHHMDDVFARLPVGSPVVIVGSLGTESFACQ